MRLRLVTILVAIGTPAGVSAAEWIFVANCGAPGQVRVYSYDSGSVSRNGSTLTVELRGDYSQVVGSAAKQARLVWRIDCARRTFVERERHEYDARGNTVASYDRSTASLGITSNSIAEKVSDRLCR